MVRDPFAVVSCVARSDRFKSRIPGANIPDPCNLLFIS